MSISVYHDSAEDMSTNYLHKELYNICIVIELTISSFDFMKIYSFKLF